MLTISDTQMALLGERRHDAFRARLARHAQELFPLQFEGLMPETIQALIADVTGRAAKHGMVTERDISKYVNLACVFGLDFDTDPALPWAAAILADTRIGPTLKINRLYLKAMEHEAEGRGLHAEPARAAEDHA